jgi:selenocysteine-specific elongation factor
MLTAFHQSQPLSEGVSREEVRERLFARADPAVFEFVLARLAGQGRVAGRDRVSLSTHRVALSGDEARARAAVEEVYRRAGLKPPDAASVAQACGLSPADCEKWTQMLVRQKILQRLDVLTFHTAALAELKREVGALKAQAGSGRATVDVAAFKERYGVTRKYAIPLLEYLDRERVTRRMGDVRVVI